MSLEGLIVSLVLVIVTVGLVALPILRRDPTARSSEGVLIQKQRERLLVYYERVLTNLRDLDEDHSTGKIQTADYESEREDWVQRGVQVLKALEQLDQHRTIVADADQESLDHAIDDSIERAVREHRRSLAQR